MAKTGKQRRTKRRFIDTLLKVRHEEFFEAMWAVRALQSGRVAAGIRVIKDIPKEAATPDYRSQYAIFPWRIETILNELLAAGEGREEDLRRKCLNCYSFNGIRHISNLMYNVECADDEEKLNGRTHILNEMHRLVQRQSEWQLGHVRHSSFYRTGFLYKGDLAKKSFAEKVGVDLDTFVKGCLHLFILYQKYSSVTLGSVEGSFGISRKEWEIILRRISLPHGRAKAVAKELWDWKSHISYRKSFLRQWPLVSFSGKYYCPLPELLMLRVSNGIYYDIISCDGAVRNEISKRFEEYVRRLLEETFFPCLPSPTSYNVRKGHPVDEPDVLVLSDKEISLVIECKATRMSFEALFSDQPIEDAKRGYHEIVKGIFQIWRYVTHCRLGLTGRQVTPGARGMLMTLDPWMMTANLLQDEVMAKARAMLQEKVPDSLPQDQIPVVFCPVVELENVCQKATNNSFMECVKAASDEKFKGWHLSTVHKELYPDVNENRPYAFREKISDVWPWLE